MSVVVLLVVKINVGFGASTFATWLFVAWLFAEGADSCDPFANKAAMPDTSIANNTNPLFMLTLLMGILNQALSRYSSRVSPRKAVTFKTF
jgi:hypothetical protein